MKSDLKGHKIQGVSGLCIQSQQRQARSGALLMGVFLLLCLHCRAGFEAYLNLPGIPGEAKETNHLNWIEVFSFSEGHGATPQETAFSPLTLLKAVDKASPLLMSFCASGQKLATAQLHFVRTTPQRLVFYDIQLKGVLISGYASEFSAVANSPPRDVLLLNYEHITWTYTALTPYGKTGEVIQTYWDLLANKGETKVIPSFRITGIQKEKYVTLTWTGAAGKNYYLLSSALVEGPYAVQAQAAAITNGPLSVTVPSSARFQYYWVEQKP